MHYELIYNRQSGTDVRYTLDVDCIVDVISCSKYYQLENKLRNLGFKQALDDDVICRWSYENTILDIMPTDESILGFSNLWYKDAIKYSVLYPLSEGLTIRIVTAPYFLATKMEAFKNRGKMDFYASHDLEDIICLLDGRLEIWNELKQSSDELKEYLADHLKNLLNDRNFQDSLPGHFNPYRSLAGDRINLLLQQINKFIESEL